MRRFAAIGFAAAAAAEGPCDITGKAGNPCVAAHSTTRALYAAYDGPLYNVTRRSDGKSANIGVLKAGGYADIAAHDAFCALGDCVISNVFDQSPMGNHLGQRHKLVNASHHKITVGGGTPVYGMWFDPGYGMHVDDTKGIATGNEEQSIYAVMSGTHYNDACCFDYGNSETDDKDDGAGTMEAIYFGNAHWRGNTGLGDGPWVGADLEQGMYYGGGNSSVVNNQSTPLPFEFVSVFLRGRTDGFVLKGGDATKGAFTTMYDGPRPFFPKSKAYQPMQKKGAIILATGGDYSNGAMGKFYEGIMVTGATTDATDAAVQANIVSVGYKNIDCSVFNGAGCCQLAGHDPVDCQKITCTVTQTLGCYADEGAARPLLPHWTVEGGSRENCARACQVAGYGKGSYYGVEDGNGCACGLTLPSANNTAPDSDCNKPCPDNSKDMCGGRVRMNIFQGECTSP